MKKAKYPALFDTSAIEIKFFWHLDEIGDTAKFLSLLKEIYKRDFPIEIYSWYEALQGRNVWAFAQEKDTARFIAMYGLMPLKFFSMGKEADGYLCHNTGVVPQYQGKGLFQYIGDAALGNTLKDSEIALGFPNRFAVKGHKRIGWQEVGKMHFYLKKDLREHEEIEFKNIHETDKFSEDINKFTLEYGERTEFSVKKDYSFLNWRISKPNQSYRCFLYKENKTILGYMIYKLFYDSKDNIKKSHIVDIMAENNAISRTLVRKAESLSKSNHTELLNIWVFERSPFVEILLREGFTKDASNYDYSVILYSPKDSFSNQVLSMVGEEIVLSLADNDVF